MINQILIKKNYCTTKEAANSLGVSVATIQKYCDSGLLKTHRTLGGHRRIPLQSLDDLIIGTTGRFDIKYIQDNRFKVMLSNHDEYIVNAFEKFHSNYDSKILMIKLPTIFDVMIEIGRVSPELVCICMDSTEYDGFNIAKSIEKNDRLKNTMVVLFSKKFSNMSNISEFASQLKGKFIFARKPIPDGWLEGFFALKIQK
jgi:excisionase family DNA binding protein